MKPPAIRLLLFPLFLIPSLLASCFDREPRRDPLRIPWEMARSTEGTPPSHPGASGFDRKGRRDPLRIPWQRPDGPPVEAEPSDSPAGLPAVEAGPGGLGEAPAPGRPGSTEVEPTAARVKTCLQSGCHGEIGESPGLHARVAIGSCLKCHLPAGDAEHRFTPAAGDGGVCRTCHPLGEPKSFVHAPFGEAKCLACHDLHREGARALLVEENEARLCGRCHERADAKVVHGPYARGECTSCHEVHESEFESLARAKPADLCIGCHDRRIEVADGARVIVDIGSLLASSTFLHGPIREGACDGCHGAHASPNANLLHDPFPDAFYQDYEPVHYALCFRCHDSSLVRDERTSTATGFRDGDRNLHYVHVNREKGRSCRGCHELHASNLPFHIRETVPFGEWELPVDFQRSDTGGTCRSGCHKEAGYDRVRAVGNYEAESREG